MTRRASGKSKRLSVKLIKVSYQGLLFKIKAKPRVTALAGTERLAPLCNRLAVTHRDIGGKVIAHVVEPCVPLRCDTRRIIFPVRLHESRTEDDDAIPVRLHEMQPHCQAALSSSLRGLGLHKT